MIGLLVLKIRHKVKTAPSPTLHVAGQGGQPLAMRPRGGQQREKVEKEARLGQLGNCPLWDSLLWEPVTLRGLEVATCWECYSC